MKHAYLIIVHKEPCILKCLVELIDDPRNDIYIHIDAKSDIAQFKNITTKHSSLYFTKRTNVIWGGYSQIKCEMILFESASKNGIYSYYHLISGQDLPIKTQDQIHEFFDRHQGKEFIQFASNDFLFHTRVRYYHFFQDAVVRSHHPFFNKIEDLLLKIQEKLHVNRNHNTIFKAGSNWVSVTDDFVRQLLKQRKWIKQKFKYTCCCDEVYKQTFCYNFGFKDKVYSSEFGDRCPSMMRLIDWSRGEPYIWTMDDIKEIEESECMFARKFDSTKDSKIINYLLQHKKTCQ